MTRHRAFSSKERPFLTVAEAAGAVKAGTRVVRIRRSDLEDLLRPARVIPGLRTG